MRAGSTKYIGTIDEDAIGSSSWLTIRGSDCSNASRSSCTGTWWAPSSRAVSAAFSQFVVVEAAAVSNGVGRPGSALVVHQAQQEAGVETATEQNAYRNVAEEMPGDRGAVQT